MLKKGIFIIVLLGVIFIASCGPNEVKEQPRLEILENRDPFRKAIETEVKKVDDCDTSEGEICNDEKSKITTDYVVKSFIGGRNRGGDGKIRIGVILKTPEGQFYREQVIQVKRDEYKKLEFTFDEVDVRNEVEKCLKNGTCLALSHEIKQESVSADTPLTDGTPRKRGVPLQQDSPTTDTTPRKRGVDVN